MITLADLQKLKNQGKIKDFKISAGKPESLTLHEAKKSKWGNVKVVVDNIKFDSTKEAERYIELKLLQTHSVISELRIQVPYQLNDGGKYSFKYIADFEYISEGKKITEDVKPWDQNKKQFVFTPLFKKKAKLMKKIHGIIIKIT